MSSDSPIRVLHALGGLGRGGIETWLCNVVRQRHPGLRMDFLLQSKEDAGGEQEAEVRRLGSRIYYRNSMSWGRRRLAALGLLPHDHLLRDINAEVGYDVFHVHGEEFNGDAVKEAAQVGIPVRVAHCHSTSIVRGKTGPEMWLRRARYFTLDRHRVMTYATDLVGCSNDAGRLMVGSRWDVDTRCRVIYCGVPTAALPLVECRERREALFRRLDLPEGAIVIGHVGTMGATPVKNHRFLLEVFAELAKRSPRYHLVMVGGGVGRPAIERLVQASGLTERVRMPGVISDVVDHMVHVFDVNVLPSLAEGLPVVALEACAAGLYTVMSDRVTLELGQHLPGRLERLSLQESIGHWANRVEVGIGRREPVEVGIKRLLESPFSIEKSTESLHQLYSTRLASFRRTHGHDSCEAAVDGATCK